MKRMTEEQDLIQLPKGVVLSCLRISFKDKDDSTGIH